MGKKQTLVFLIHAHFAVTTVLSNYLLNTQCKLVMYLVIIFFSKISWPNDNIWQIWLIISILPTTKMSYMLKHFRSRVSAEVKQLCLLAKLWLLTVACAKCWYIVFKLVLRLAKDHSLRRLQKRSTETSGQATSRLYQTVVPGWWLAVTSAV